MSNDTALTDDEIAILRAHGYEPAGSDGILWLQFRQKRDGKIVRAICSEWRLMIAGFQRPPTEDTDLAQRLEVLTAILTDPANQLEVSADGLYIYRFDLATMHRIADAIGIPKADPVEMFTCYTPEELPGLIKPD